MLFGIKSLHNLYSIYEVTTLQDITTYQEAKAEFAEVLVLPLIYVINTYMKITNFPDVWKIGIISTKIITTLLKL